MPHAQGNHHPSITPYGLFSCKDGMLQIACGSEGLWVKLASAFGIDPAGEGMATNRERVANRDAVNAAVNAAFADRTLAELLTTLDQIGVPAGEVRTLDRVYEWDQTRCRAWCSTSTTRSSAPIEIPGPPIRFDNAAGGREEHFAHAGPAQRVGARLARRAGPVMSVKPRRLGALELLETVLDEGSWKSWDADPVQPTAADSPYAAELAAAAKAGTDESIVTGEGMIRGRRVAIIAGEFRFLAGSIGSVAAERIVLAFERPWPRSCPSSRLPPRVARACRRAPQPSSAWSRSAPPARPSSPPACPTSSTSGTPPPEVFASWGSLGHVTVAEPGAMIGFLGARVYEALYGQPFPEGVQTAENLFEHGLIDAVARRGAGRGGRPRAQRAHGAARGPARRAGAPEGAAARPPAWDSITRSRREDRPGVRTLLRLGATDVLPLHGTGQGEYDPGMLMALARFGGAPCVVLGQDRRGQTLEDPLSPKGLRVARRGMKLAHELNLPLVSVIDTAGAALSKEAEEGGMAGEIARCLSELVTLDAPTLCVLLGQGTGGGALAVMPADRVICAQHSWLSPLPPEGASAILYRETSHAPELAESQRVRSLDLLADGIVDRIVAEHPDAADEPEEFCQRMSQSIQHELATLARMDRGERLQARLDRYRRLGQA